MKGNDIREAYLSFFETKKEHLRLKSFPLIPKDDPSLLLIGAGMAPLKPYVSAQAILKMLAVQQGIIPFLKCLGISLLVITLRRKPLPGHGNF